MSILAKFTVTPLLWSCGILLVALLATGAFAAVLGAQLETAQADVRTADGATVAARTERDAWKAKATELGAANTAYGTAVRQLMEELERAQQEAHRIDAAGQQAVANAQAAQADAERTLARMAAQFQAQAREPDCARALSELVRACPAMEGY